MFHYLTFVIEDIELLFHMSHNLLKKNDISYAHFFSVQF